MDFLQGLDGGVVLLGLGLVILCVIFILFFFGFQLIAGTFFGVIELVMGIIGGGPGVWCGCLVLLFACMLCAGGVLVYTTCSTNPSAMNFCLLFSGGL